MICLIELTQNWDLTEDNILENSNLNGVEDLPDAVIQEDLLDKKNKKEKNWDLSI